jgi:hypothetical protein
VGKTTFFEKHFMPRGYRHVVCEFFLFSIERMAVIHEVTLHQFPPLGYFDERLIFSAEPRHTEAVWKMHESGSRGDPF